MMDEHLIEQSTLRTYRPSGLSFDTPVEEEDVTEWMHIEPPRNEKIDNPILPEKKQ